MTKPKCHCIVGSSILASPHASGRTHREAAPGFAEPVFHIVGVGRDVMLCGEQRSRTGMMGRRTSSLLLTERGASAALGALDGTYLVRMFESWRLRKRPTARATRRLPMMGGALDAHAHCVASGMTRVGLRTARFRAAPHSRSYLKSAHVTALYNFTSW